jgi:hypothetical protein
LTFAAVVAGLVALATPAVASAGTASTRTITFRDRYNDSGSRTVVGLRYQAGNGERNRVTIDVDERGATIVDAAGIRPGRGCRLTPGTGRREVRCRFRGLGGLGAVDERDEVRVRARLGARRDSVVVRGDFPGSPEWGTVSIVTLEGGPGPDRLGAGADEGVFVGGRGDDRMVGGPGVDSFVEGRGYGSDTFSGGGQPLLSDGDRVAYGRRTRGIVADLAGDRDDGERGERDLIGADVESILGGRGSDRLTGNGEANGLSGGGGRFDVIDGGAGTDRIRHGARGGIVRSRDGEFDQLGCGSERTRALADGYDEIYRCAPERSEPAGLIVDVGSSRGQFDLDDHRDGVSGPPSGVRFTVGCPPDFGRSRCAGRARLLGADGRTLGETAFDFPKRDEFDFLVLPVAEQDRQRIQAAGHEAATLVVDTIGVPERRYAITIRARRLFVRQPL